MLTDISMNESHSDTFFNSEFVAFAILGRDLGRKYFRPSQSSISLSLVITGSCFIPNWLEWIRNLLQEEEEEDAKSADGKTLAEIRLP